MPLLKKKSFQKYAIPENLKDDEEIFYCEFTDEVFRDYEEYSERMFLYNSMVWTCSMSGKSNLTYQEALESEENARRSLKELPMELRIPILFIGSKTQRSAFVDMAEDVFGYMKDRYFIGENLETSFTGDKWKESHVLQVIVPTDVATSPPKNGAKNERHFWPPAQTIKYEIEHLDADDKDISEIMIVDYNQIRRKKGVFSKDKCKLFLKQYVEHDKFGMITIKPSALENFGVYKMKFDQIFDGPLPKFETTKKNPNGKKHKQESIAKFLTMGKQTTEPSDSDTKSNLYDQLKKREEEFQLLKQQKEELRLQMKKNAKMEYIQVEKAIREFHRPKEDLLLENQKKLPLLTPVKTKIPDQYFGDIVMIMDFVHNFSKFLSTKNFFPTGLTLDLMERALTEVEIAGPFTDLIQMLLTALFNLQDEESKQYKTVVRENTADNKEDESVANMSLTDATRLATMASKLAKKHLGQPVSRLPLYSVTVSEILRLHLLGSGARINETGARWRYAQRGGYTSEDDPGLHFRLHQPQILKALAVQNVVQLPMGDKLKIIDCLINQLLTYADIRDVVEDKIDKIRKMKQEIKNIQIADRKLDQDYLANKMKLKKEKKGQPNLSQELDKLEKQFELKHQEHLYQISKQFHNIYQIHSMLGMDRAYRRYIRVDNIPAIFVNTEAGNGVCLDSITKQNPKLVDASRSELFKHFKQTYRNKSNSLPLDDTKPPSEINGTEEHEKTTTKEQNTSSELYMCSADPGSCIIHSNKTSQTSWSFIHCQRQLDELEKNLNKRGTREGELLQVIKNDKDRLHDIIDQTPVHLLNPDVDVPEDEQKSSIPKKSGKDRYEDANLGYPVDMTTEQILEHSLLDNILEMEEKINAGALGQLPVKNREEWRNCLSNKKYELVEKFVKKSKDRVNSIKNEEGNKSRSSTPELPTDMELDKYTDPGKYLGITLDESDEYSDAQKNTVTSLAMALVQVAYAVDAKYLKRPLGRSRTKNYTKQEQDILDKWAQSLLSSSSYSQVFLHYSTLDSCVMWYRSALLARCRICRSKKDSENMLLCDHCNVGHHLYCLKPKLTTIPKGDWFCNKCRKEKADEAKIVEPPPNPKKRRIFRNEDVEEEEDDNCEVEEQSDDETEDDVKLCKICGSGGELICCEKCSTSYHIECCDPPLRRPPRGSWCCNTCKKQIGSKKRRYSDSSDKMMHTRRSNRSEDLPINNSALQELLSDVIRHKDAWPFVKPVLKNEVPEYYDVIAKPMDFGTIKYKLNMGEYTEDQLLMNDVILIFENCNTYYDSDAEVYKCGVRLMRYFAKKAKDLGLKLPEELDLADEMRIARQKLEDENDWTPCELLYLDSFQDLSLCPYF